MQAKEKIFEFFVEAANDGGQGGIRTPDEFAPIPHFECGAFNRALPSVLIPISKTIFLDIQVFVILATISSVNLFS